MSFFSNMSAQLCRRRLFVAPLAHFFIFVTYASPFLDQRTICFGSPSSFLQARPQKGRGDGIYFSNPSTVCLEGDSLFVTTRRLARAYILLKQILLDVKRPIATLAFSFLAILSTSFYFQLFSANITFLRLVSTILTRLWGSFFFWWVFNCTISPFVHSLWFSFWRFFKRRRCLSSFFL